MIKVGIYQQPSVAVNVSEGERINVDLSKESGIIKGKDGHSPYIGQNGTWMLFDDTSRQWIDSNVKAQGGSVVIESIQETDIDDEYNKVLFSNGNEINIKNGKTGHTPIKNVDYWTDEDKAQMAQDVTRFMPVLSNLEIKELLV